MFTHVFFEPPVAWGRPQYNRSLGIFYPHKPSQKFGERLAEDVLSSFDPSEIELPHFEAGRPLGIDLDFVLPRPKSLRRKKDQGGLIWFGKSKKNDLDNLIKAVWDGLSKVMWDDDGRLVQSRSRKFYAEKWGAPRICMRVYYMREEPVFLCTDYGFSEGSWDESLDSKDFLMIDEPCEQGKESLVLSRNEDGHLVMPPRDSREYDELLWSFMRSRSGTLND